MERTYCLGVCIDDATPGLPFDVARASRSCVQIRFVSLSSTAIDVPMAAVKLSKRSNPAVENEFVRALCALKGRQKMVVCETKQI